MAIHNRLTFTIVDENANLHGGAIIDDTMTDITVRYLGEGTARMTATFRAMPALRSVLSLYVDVPDDKLDVAAAIVGSVRLVHE